MIKPYLTKEAIKDFKTAWKKDFNQDISDNDATEYAIRLISFFQALSEAGMNNTPNQ